MLSLGAWFWQEKLRSRRESAPSFLTCQSKVDCPLNTPSNLVPSAARWLPPPLFLWSVSTDGTQVDSSKAWAEPWRPGSAGLSPRQAETFSFHPLLTSDAQHRGQLEAAEKAVGPELGHRLHNPHLDELASRVGLSLFSIGFGLGEGMLNLRTFAHQVVVVIVPLVNCYFNS